MMAERRSAVGPLAVPQDARPKIAIVGPCASGKSTLANALNDLGYRANQVAQEHSYVQDMWQVISKPQYLIVLDCDYVTTLKRKSLGWTEKEYDVQHARLDHAREHCDLFIDTSQLSISQVLDFTRSDLESSGKKL